MKARYLELRKNRRRELGGGMIRNFKGRWETEMKGLLKGERGSRKEGGE